MLRRASCRVAAVCATFACLQSFPAWALVPGLPPIAPTPYGLALEPTPQGLPRHAMSRPPLALASRRALHRRFAEGLSALEMRGATRLELDLKRELDAFTRSPP
jgi:hypothetical protein